MKKLVVLGLGLLLTLNPIKINANQECEEWQLELLERATYQIQPNYKNEIIEIDGQYYLYEEVEAYTTDWTLISGWSQSSSGYFRTNEIDVLSQWHDPGEEPYDIASNLIKSASFNTVSATWSDLVFTTNTRGYYRLSIRINSITTITELHQYLNDNNFTIYYKLDEPRTTLLDWYDPNPTPPEPTPSNYTFLLVPSLLVVIGVMIYIDRKYIKEVNQ